MKSFAASRPTQIIRSSVGIAAGAALLALAGGFARSSPAQDPDRHFAYAAAVSGDRAVVGAAWHDGFRGTAFVLRNADGRWILEQRLTLSDLGRRDHFGSAVAISGNIIVVGAPWHDLFRGAAYVFTRENGSWTPAQELVPTGALPEQHFGQSVRISADGISISGTPIYSSGRVLRPECRFERTADGWVNRNGIVVSEAGRSTTDVLATQQDDVSTATLRDLLEVVSGNTGPAPLQSSTPPDPPEDVTATFGATELEDRVEINWTGVGLDAIVYKVLRDGQLVSVVSSDETHYSDATGTLGVTYSYCVVVKDMAGQESPATACADGRRSIFAPIGMSASDGEYVDHVRIDWVDVSAINTGYTIRRDSAAIGTASANATVFDDTTAVQGIQFHYDVVATVTGGFESAAGSDSGWVGYIRPPRNVTASDGKYLDRVKVTWEDSEPPVNTGFRVYRDGFLLGVTTPDTTSFVDSTVAFGATYTYCVASLATSVTGVSGVMRTSEERSDESIRVCDEGGAGLTAPGEVSASDSTYDDRIRVTWVDRSQFEDGYEISRTAFGHTVVLGISRANATSYDDFTAGPDTTFTYFVHAVSDLGSVSPDSSDTGYRSIVLAPTDVTASDGTYEDCVNVTWKSVSTTAVLFKIYRDAEFIKSVGKATRTYRDYGGTAGEVYDYKVSAVTALEDTADGLPDEGKRELLAPSRMAAGDEEYEDRVVVSWNDNSRVEAGYRVSRHDTEGVEPDDNVDIGPNRTSYTDYSGTPGTTYAYSVAAFDSVSGIVGYSQPGEDQGRRVLLAPTGVQADDGVSETTVEITWNDNSDAEDGYRLYRLSASDTVVAGETGDNTTSFLDHPPVLGISYLYRVCAFDNHGESESGDDQGNTTILAPVSMNASDEYSDEVHLTWIDRSEVEQGYRVYRDEQLIATLVQNATDYRDEYHPPGIVGSFDTPNIAFDAHVSGEHVYVADYLSGLQVIGIDDPAHPTGVGSVDTPGNAQAVFVLGDHAYVADGAAGLQVIDITDPANPIIVGNVGTPDYAYGVYVAGNYAYVAELSAGLHVVDISDPEHPAGVGNLDTPGSAYGVYASDTYVYVADRSAGLRVVDVSDPAHPIDTGSIDTPGSANAVFVTDQYAYVADDLSGLQVIDCSDPANPSLVGTVDTPGSAKDVYVSGIYAYVADFAFGIQVIDVTDPTQPTTTRSVSTPDLARGIFVSNGYVYVGASYAGLEIVRPAVAPGELGIGNLYDYCVRAYADSLVSEAECSLGSLLEVARPPGTERLFKILANDGAGGDQFGTAVGVSGPLGIVGAPGDDAGMGAAYVFLRDDDGMFHQEEKLLADDGVPNDLFGKRAAISGDLAIVGSGGAAYVFRRADDGSWAQEDKLLPDDGAGGFGSDAAISGNIAVVGAQFDEFYGLDSGSAYVFVRGAGGTWTQEQKLLPDDGEPYKRFGCAAAVDGNYAVVGAPGDDENGSNAGAAYCYRREEGGIWAQEDKLLADDGEPDDDFGTTVAIWGGTVIVAAPGDDDNGEGSGAAYVFSRREDGVWAQEQKLLPDDGAPSDYFGSVTIGQNVAIVGAVNDDDMGSESGSAYVFRRSGGGRWTQVQKLLATDGTAGASFGVSVGVSGDLVMIGAYHDSSLAQGSGCGYTLDLQPAVSASDGVYGGRINVTWVDEFTNESGFVVYRDGVLRAQVPANAEVYDDVGDPSPGRAYEYRVTALVDSTEFNLGADLGWRPADGEIRGRVATQKGAGVKGVRVYLAPPATRALLFDGIHGSGRIPTTGEMSFGRAQCYTLEAWIKYSGEGGSSGNHGTILGKTGAAIRYPFLLRTDRGNGTPGRLVFSMSDGSATVSVASSRTDLNSGEWVHVACVHDTSLKALQLYINGALDSTTVYTTLDEVSNPDDLSLGGSSFGSYGGQIDEVRIWNVALDSTVILGSMSTPLTGDETHLVGYWPFDEDGDKAAVGRVAGSPYCLLEFGVYRTDDVAPLEAGAITDGDGNYSLVEIPYGDYEVRPSSGNRQFTPPVTRVALNAGSPVQNQVNFSDISSFTVAGTIKYAGTGCGAANIPIMVDSRAAGSTDSKGKFSVAVDLGAHWIRPDLEGHTFGPDSLFVDAQKDTVVDGPAGVAFTDSTTQVLSGRLGGGCGAQVGDLTLTIRSENDCLLKTLQYSAEDTSYSVSLPPQSYLVSASVDPQSIPKGLNMTDVIRYFQNLGVRLAEMDSLDVTMDFVYRAPLRVSIHGFEDFAETCPGPLTFGVRSLPDGLPVIPQLTVLPYRIEVYEDYGGGTTCPLDSGTVTVYDEIFDRQNIPFQLEVRDGVALDTTFASTPSLVVGRIDEHGVDRSFQKSITAVAETEGRTPVTATEWVLVTGHVAPEGADFVTGTSMAPMYILRDPPGDQSYAYLEEGEQVRTTIEWSNEIKALGAGPTASVWIGSDVKWFVGLGAGNMGESEAGKLTELDWVFGTTTHTESTTDVTCTFRRTLSTSPDDVFIGGDGDVFFGFGYNFIFSEVGVVGVTGCTVTKTSAVGFEPDSLYTFYAYTQQYIRDSLIPELESKGAYYDSIGEPDSSLVFQAEGKRWGAMLAENDSLKAHTSFELNRSFSAGADFAYTAQGDSTRSYVHTEIATIDGEFRFGGFGWHTDWFGIEFGMHLKHHEESLDRGATSNDSTWTQTIGYTLSDSDLGDHYTVNIGSDGRYPSPVFDVRAGVSSCPYEPWPDPEPDPSTGLHEPRMMPRDEPDLNVSPVRRDDVPPDEPAEFTLNLSNLSPTGETRLYVLRLLTNSNPYGAIVKVAGSTIANGLQQYYIDPGQAQQATLSIERGPTRYKYEDLALILYAPCEYDLWEGKKGGQLQRADTVRVSVTFDAPCSDVTMLVPGSGWRFTKADQDTGQVIQILLTDYERQISEAPDDTLITVGVECRRSGIGRDGPTAWRDCVAPQVPDSLNTLFLWAPQDTLEDGVYELRGYTHCKDGYGYTEIVTGTIERHGPQVLGTPEPADGELSFGEDISITFNEPIDCRSVLADSISLTYLDGPDSSASIPVETVCNDATIVITPDASAADLEGRRLRARVVGVTDKAGNPMLGEVTWDFVCRQSQFTWSQLHLAADVPYRNPGTLTTNLVNGTEQPVVFSITDWPEWIDGIAPSSGAIPPNGKTSVDFSLQSNLDMDVYRGEVKAAADDTTQGVALFDLEVTVSCHEPEWMVEPSDFEHSMTMVAELDIGGTQSINPNDRVAAFVGNQLRGVASLQEVPIGSLPYPHLAFLTVYSNRVQGEMVRFKVWEADSCKLYNATIESYPFVADSTIGSASAPVTLTATDTGGSGELTIAANQGWTWFSTNVTSADMSVGAVLADLTPAAGDLVKSQAAFSQFVDGATGWTGGLTSLDNRYGYMIRLSAAGEIRHAGPPADMPIPVQQGWNWIGYLPQEPMDVSDALDDLTVEGLSAPGDVIKSQSGFAEYTGTGWYGSLQIMEPGMGYKLHLTSAASDSFDYPTGVSSPGGPPLLAHAGSAGPEWVGRAAAGLAEGAPAWSVNPCAYEYNMTVTAVLKIGADEAGDANDRIGAFVGDECRGVASPMYVAGLDRHEVFLMVHSDQGAGEEVVLRAFDADAGVIYNITETVVFEADGIVGRVQDPLLLNAGTVWDGGTTPRTFALVQNRPNPFAATTRIAYDVPAGGGRVTIRVYDVAGRLVRTLVDGVEAPGGHIVDWDRLNDRGQRVQAGVYFYRMTAPGFEKSRRMAIIR